MKTGRTHRAGRSTLALALAAALAAAPWAGAASSTQTAVESVRGPLREGLAEVAIVRADRLLEQSPDPATRSEVEIARAEALLAAGRPEAALLQITGAKLETQAPLLTGRIHGALGQWEEALAAYRSANGTTGAAFGEAEALAHLGRLPEAIAAVEKQGDQRPSSRLRLAELYLQNGALEACERLLKSIRTTLPYEENWRQYLLGRQMLAAGHPAYAVDRFSAIYNENASEQTVSGLQMGALLGLSAAYEALEQHDLADDLLETFLWRHPDAGAQALLFRRLDELYRAQREPSVSVLERMARREPSLRAGYAHYYLAREYERRGQTGRALEQLADDTRFSAHPIRAEALLLKGHLLTLQGDSHGAQEVLEEAMRAAKDDTLRAEIEMATASAYFEAGEYLLAATLFRAAGERAPVFREQAIFNSALSWLHQGNHRRFMDDYVELSRIAPEGRYRRELLLEEGLLEAREGEPKAEETLHLFLRDFPDNPRAADANLALAELRFAANDLKGASQYRRAVGQASPEPETRRQSDYLAIFIADAAQPRHGEQNEKVIALCRAFLDAYPEAPQRAEVRMKLGEVFFRQGDFPGAQSQFEALAREDPASPLAGRALFLAGQSAMKSMDAGGIDRALVLFEEVAQKETGELRFEARLQQALAQTLLERPAEAILLYDTVLEAAPPDEIRFAASVGKAESLVQLGSADPKQLEAALALYEQLAQEFEGDLLRRNQASCQKARLLERLERPEEALAAYYDVLEKGASQPEEYFWFYKAGFDAARLCEARRQWKSAIAIYSKMGALEGPRSEEARTRLKKLRLEHFIWE
ncbi:MAG TPA: tetratricopeptide repeat protein [Chthoniobacteraceae bacterium]|nr:tetratricopeptide repeat protein [Chthoniobacteraceae bacterium]